VIFLLPGRSRGASRQVSYTKLLTDPVEAGDEDAPIWQLSCTLYWNKSPQTEGLGAGNLWSFGMTLDEFFNRAAGLPGWAWPLASPPVPRDLEIRLDEIC